MQLGANLLYLVRRNAQFDSPRRADAFCAQNALVLRHSACKKASILDRYLHANGHLSYGDKVMLVSEVK